MLLVAPWAVEVVEIDVAAGEVADDRIASVGQLYGNTAPARESWISRSWPSCHHCLSRSLCRLFDNRNFLRGQAI